MYEKVIDKKPIVNINGEEKIDFLAPIFKEMNSFEIDYEVLKVPEEHNMRPDLTSIAYYGEDTYTELILKFNGISNPFTYQSGLYIILPDKTYITKMLKDNIVSSVDSDKTSFQNNILIEMQNSYKYVNPKNIKEIIDISKRNKVNIKIPQGANVPYINPSKENGIKYDKNGNAIIDTNLPTNSLNIPDMTKDIKKELDTNCVTTNVNNLSNFSLNK